MKYTNRSLWFAVLACLAMGFFARAPQILPGHRWIGLVLLGATFLLSGIGFWWGLRGARQQRTLWSWLAVGINAFVFVFFLVVMVWFFRVLERLQ
ncbi:MAG: hypothetical protein R3D58_18185 [Saprospiraceae bacterium]|jgi:hypothetical protein|nr:hypothetical protein [Lewinellaceae bacterium]